MNDLDNRTIGRIAAVVIVIGGIVWLASSAFKTVPAGHVAVATLFGKVVKEPFKAGMHFPVNPLYKWSFYDVRFQTLMERAGVPSQDQMTTQVDLSVQYNLNGEMAPTILQETGTAAQAVNVHLVPNVRSLLREQGKTIPLAQDFFLEATQQRLQQSLLEALRSYLTPKGIDVEAVLIRDITLPPVLTKAIEEKKQREQEVEKEKAELARYATEQQKMVARALAQRKAAEEEAKRRRMLAEAQAFEIQKINEAISSNPAYIQLQAIEALKSISKDPAAKIYFLNGDSPMPLPLMHMGETAAVKP